MHICYSTFAFIFMVKNSLKITNMKDYCCSEFGCSRSYTNPYNMKRHQIRNHLKTAVFECETCQKQLSSSQNLKEHLNLHSGEKPFQCPVCKARFRFSSNYSAHKKLHKGMLPTTGFKELKVKII